MLVVLPIKVWGWMLLSSLRAIVFPALAGSSWPCL